MFTLNLLSQIILKQRFPNALGKCISTYNIRYIDILQIDTSLGVQISSLTMNILESFFALIYSDFKFKVFPYFVKTYEHFIKAFHLSLSVNCNFLFLKQNNFSTYLCIFVVWYIAVHNFVAGDVLHREMSISIYTYFYVYYYQSH